jgi:NAD(P)-dependent dehydrogenase (short-subunit alcohol dehydrogenase family)
MPSDHKKWARHNVFYNTIRVGVTDTKIHKIDKSKNMDKRISLIPIGRMAKTEEISKFVYWLGSNENTYITGQIISVAGGE